MLRYAVRPDEYLAGGVGNCTGCHSPLKGSALLRFSDRETFVARFQKGGRKFEGSPMPWKCFAHLAEDAGALYEFLKTRPPSGEFGVRRSNGPTK